MTQAFYRPVYAVGARGGVTADGDVTGVAMDCLSQSIALSSEGMISAAIPPGVPAPISKMVVGALLAMFRSNSMPDMFATEGLANTKYALGNFRLGAEPVQTKLPVTAWRSVGNSVTGFVMESFIDELAIAAKADPFAFRRKLLPKGNTKQTRVLDALEKLSGWTPGAAVANGRARGMARHFAFESEVGEVAEIEIVDGRIKVRKVFCVVDCGLAVNPDIVKAQMEGGIIFGLSAALDQEITLVDGVVQQTNFDTFAPIRMFEAPEIVVEVIDSPDEPTGVGEPGLPPIAPAVANAIFALTGKRLRRMPLQRALNEGGAA
jgi:CO/xanthine dehydrogenase Mo-binding subunit